MSDKTIRDAQQAVVQLENSITALIQEYEKMYGAVFKDMDVTQDSRVGQRLPRTAYVRIRIEI